MITPGGRVGDASPLGKGKRKLSDYERMVAHALMRRGIPKERAIPMARGVIDRAAKSGRWGRGKKASPNVVAGAAASVAQRKSFSASHKLANEGATIPTMKPDYLLAVLDKKSRDSLDTSEFAIPETRSYPIPDLTHARVALAMVKVHGSAEEQAKVRAAVVKKYPALKLSNSARDVLFAEAAERGLLDLGMDGAKWKHGYIPLNAIAAAIKAKKWHGHGGSKGNLPSGKSRINVGSNAAHAMAPKGKARATAAQRARSEAARRPGFADIAKNAREGKYGPEAKAAQLKHESGQGGGVHGEAAAKLTPRRTEQLPSRTVASMAKGELIKRSSRLNHVTPDGFAVKHSPEFNDHGGHTGGYSVSIEDTTKSGADRHIAGGRYTKGTDNAATEAEIAALGRARDKRRGNKQIDDRYTMKPQGTTATAKALQAEHDRRSAPAASGTTPYFDTSKAKVQGGMYSGHSLEAADHLMKFKTGDKVVVKDKESGKEHVLTVNRSGRGDGGGFGSAESHTVGATFGPGRYTYNVSNSQVTTGKLNIRHATPGEIRTGNVGDGTPQSLKPRTNDAPLGGHVGTPAEARRQDLLDQAKAERARRDAGSGKVSLTGNESYNLTTGKRVETTSAPSSSGGSLSDTEVSALHVEKARISARNSVNKRAIRNSNLSSGTHPAEASVAADTKRLGQVNRALKKHYAARDARQAAEARAKQIKDERTAGVTKVDTKTGGISNVGDVVHVGTDYRYHGKATITKRLSDGNLEVKMSDGRVGKVAPDQVHATKEEAVAKQKPNDGGGLAAFGGTRPRRRK